MRKKMMTTKCHWCADKQHKNNKRWYDSTGLVPVCKVHSGASTSRIEKLEYNIRQERARLIGHELGIEQSKAALSRLERKLHAAKHFGTRKIRGRLAKIREADMHGRIELEKTLVQYVEGGFEKAACARSMYVHINTLTYRLEQLAKVLGEATLSARDYLEIYIEIRTGSAPNSVT